MSFLPEKDLDYLKGKELPFEEALDGSQKVLILKSYPLDGARFDAAQVDILVMIPQGFPDIGPDMFYTFPWLRLRDKNCYPRAADQPLNFLGKTWQRWSRHSNDWRPGRDGIRTVLKRVEHAFESAEG
jgi:hypothetical protein